MLLSITTFALLLSVLSFTQSVHAQAPGRLRREASANTDDGNRLNKQRHLETAKRPPSAFNWRTVANNNDEIPESNGRKYNSYNAPSININGLVVFRARSKGHQGGRSTGIFIKQSQRTGGPAQDIFRVIDLNSNVTQPNNAGAKL